MIRGSSAKHLRGDEVTVEALPSFPGKTLIIVEVYSTGRQGPTRESSHKSCHETTRYFVSWHDINLQGL